MCEKQLIPRSIFSPGLRLNLGLEYTVWKALTEWHGGLTAVFFIFLSFLSFLNLHPKLSLFFFSFFLIPFVFTSTYYQILIDYFMKYVLFNFGNYWFAILYYLCLHHGVEQGNQFSEASAEQRCSYMNVSAVFDMLICVLLSMSSWVMFYIVYPRSLLGLLWGWNS